MDRPIELDRAPPLIWDSAWAEEGESLFSGLMKLAMVNTLGAPELLRRVFNSRLSQGSSLPIHKRSLLNTDWTVAYPPDQREIFIVALCARSQRPESRLLVSFGLDTHLRYCPECLSQGIHYPEFQIESLAKCPIHDVDLLISCRTCASPTSRYAITEETFHSPYRCGQCGAYLAGEFDLEKLAASRKQKAEIHSAAIGKFNHLRHWLRVASKRRASWSEGDSWILSDLEPDPVSERRKILFSAAQRSLPWLALEKLSINSVDDRWQIQEVGRTTTAERSFPPGRARDDVAAERIRVYKSIRRHIFRTYVRPHQKCLRKPAGGGLFGWLDRTCLPDARLCVWVQAWMLWRSRFETTFQQESLLRKRSPSNWKTAYAGGVWDSSLAENEWATLVWFSFHASFRTMRCWIDSRWKLLAQGCTSVDHWEFKALPTPYHQLFAISVHKLEVQVAVIKPAAEPGISGVILVGADEASQLRTLGCVCHPFFPHV